MVVFTHGWRRSPLARAFRATSPAPIMTDGLDVFVQLVMAAMTMEPSDRSNRSPSYWTSATVTTSRATAVPVAGELPPSPAQREPSVSGTARLAPEGIRSGSP
jgi:hypothetical protein